VHKVANVLNALPKTAHPGGKAALAEIYNAEDKRHAQAAAKAFAGAYGAKFPKAVAKITDDLDVLLAFYEYPAEHWIHLRTSNPIESTFATVRHRTRVTKGPGSRAAGLAMAFKLTESAQQRWRAVNAPHLVALVRNVLPQRTARRTPNRSGRHTTCPQTVRACCLASLLAPRRKPASAGARRGEIQAWTATQNGEAQDFRCPPVDFVARRSSYCATIW